jgi:poly(A) polymerase
VLVGVGPHWIEIATFRTDADYRDGRRPTAVHFTTPRNDARRRDFTINGMFYDPLAREVVDHVGGRRDLSRRLIRAIGDPSRRFAEDHLRMLRAVRFAARLGFRIEPRTLDAIRRHARHIARVSAERICEELRLILTHPGRAVAWRLLNNAGLLPHLWPGADALAEPARETCARLAALPQDASFELGLAAILLHASPHDVRHTCAALRTSNRTRDTVAWLAANRPRLDRPDALTLADLKLLMARPAFKDLLALFAADLRAARRPPAPHRRLVRRAAAVPADRVAPPPLLTGDDLHRMRVPQGPVYRDVLDRVYYAQLNDEIADHAAACALARRLLDGS